jgi:hypothetical protein
MSETRAPLFVMGRGVRSASVLSPLTSVFSARSPRVRQNTEVDVDTRDHQGYVCRALAPRRT